MKDFEKSEHEVLREEQLARQDPEIEFRLPSRTLREIDEDVMNQLHFIPHVFLSKDKQTIVCYHPPPKDYPESFTKPARSTALNPDAEETFRDVITAEEIAEGTELLRNTRIWSSKALSKLFKVKKAVVEANIQLTEEQSQIFKAEQSIYACMSQMKRRKFQQLKTWERVKYVRETRGKDEANWFKTVGVKSKPRTANPYKF